MMRLKQLLTEAGNLLVHGVNPDACEAFLRKYPKVRTVMTSIARKNKDLMRGYKQFLAFKDKHEKELGGRPETVKSGFGEKTYWKYDWMGATGWAEIYQYIDGTKLESVKEASDRDTAMVSGVADIVSKVKDGENRKEIAQQMMSKFDLEDVDYDKTSFLKLSKVSEAFSKGQLFAGNLKIDGQKVPVEVELIGADNTKRTFTAKVIHIDKKYYSRLPKDGILNIPAQIFRMTGGWRKIKTPSVFK